MDSRANGLAAARGTASPERDPATLAAAVLDTLHRIAPEASPREIDPAQPLRDQVDLGSMDWFNFLAALQEATGVEIPEGDGAKLRTLNDVVAYLRAKA